MTRTLAQAPLAEAARHSEDGLAAAAPNLMLPFRAALPRAVATVNQRLRSAIVREGLAGEAPHGGEPAEVLARVVPPGPGRDRVIAELTNATVNLAVAYARRDAIDDRLRTDAIRAGARDLTDLAAPLDPDAQCRFFERLATEGHNLHPCGRTRLGWSVADVLAHDLETEVTEVGFVGVRQDLHVGDDVGALLGVDPPAPGYVVTPVHGWQLDAVVRTRYADLVADGALVPLDTRWPAQPTAALRTVLTDGLYLKLSLDIQVTSTRRSISVASTRNGPAVSAVLDRAVPGDRVLLLSETAGSALAGSRDLAAIVRTGLSGRLAPGEVAVPGSALPARSPLTGATILTELVDRYARHHAIADPSTAGLRFLNEYARLLLPPVLELAARHGIGFEAHLQNCIPTFVDGVPTRLALRDFAGMRIYPPKLRYPLAVWPGSVVVTDDPEVVRAKVGYTALQAHLGEIVAELVDSHGVAEGAAWAVVRAVLDEVYDGLGRDGAADHEFFTRPTVPHKALLRMRLADDGDIYVPVRNPLR